MILQFYVDDETMRRLIKIEAETCRSIGDLASSVVAEEAMRYFRYRADDPADLPPTRENGHERLADNKDSA